MNHNQKKYAQSRVDQITRHHAAAIESSGKAKRCPELTVEEKCRLIRDGKAKFKPDRVVASGRYPEAPSVTDVYDFPEAAKIEAHNARVAEEQAKRLARLRVEADDLRDELVLGDEAAALDKIREFSKKVF